MKNKSIIITILLILCLIISSCGKQDSAKKPYPGTKDKDMVTVNLGQEPPELNSILFRDTKSGNILRMSMSGLTKLDKDDNPQPDVAQKWEISDDQTIYTMHLRNDMKWSNGEPVTAHDFIFSWTLGMTKETAAPNAYFMYESIKNGKAFYEGKIEASELGIKALDDYTLEIELNAPIPYALALFASPYFLPVNQKAYETIGADKYGKEADQMVTNGAYKFSEWVHDSHIVMTKNEEYYGAKEIFIPKVKFVMISDNNAALNAFKAGEIDSTSITGEQMQSMITETETVKTYVDNGNWFFKYNTQNEIMSNVKMRKAVGMAIDTKQLCDKVLKDGAVWADGFIPPSISGAEGEFYAKARGSIISSDTTKAKSLFEEALKELNMSQDEIKLKYLSDSSTYGQLQAAYFKEQWKTVLGIDVEVVLLPYKARLEATQNGQYDILLSGWGPDYNDPEAYLSILVSDNANNTGKYSSEEYDALMESASSENDPTKRQDLLIQAEKIMLEDGAVTPLYFSSTPYVVSSKLTGLLRSGFQEIDFRNGAKIAE